MSWIQNHTNSQISPSREQMKSQKKERKGLKVASKNTASIKLILHNIVKNSVMEKCLVQATV